MGLNKTTSLIKIIGIVLAAAVFSGACTSSAGRGLEQPDILSPDLANHPIYSSYNFGEDEKVIDIGIQPLWVPTSAISEVMKHDKILQDALEQEGFEIRFHSFSKGIDVNYFFGQGNLEAGFRGDLPTLGAIYDLDVQVAALVQHGFTSIVADKPILVSDLRGKRIGTPEGSLAHYALIKALSDFGISASSVTLVFIDVDELPTALESGKIDAFSGWEPAPTISTLNLKQNYIINRSLSWGFLYFSSAFSEDHPDVVRLITASSLRALNWMQQDSANIRKASEWALETEKKFYGEESKLSPLEYSGLIHDDILTSMLYPYIPEKELMQGGHLWEEFQFMKDEGILPETATWEMLIPNFSTTIVPEIINQAQIYELDNFHYLDLGGAQP